MKESAMQSLDFHGIPTITIFCRRYRLPEAAKNDLITMQAFHQGVAMFVGALAGVAIGYILFVVL